MIKKLANISLILLLSVTFITIEAKSRTEKLQKALQKADKRIEKLDGISKNDLMNLIEYLEFYASWYAAVTPAAAGLREALSPDASTFVQKMKKYAKPLQKKTDRRLMGSSRLSEEGKTFYKNVLQVLRKKITDS